MPEEEIKPQNDSKPWRMPEHPTNFFDQILTSERFKCSKDKLKEKK